MMLDEALAQVRREFKQVVVVIAIVGLMGTMAAAGFHVIRGFVHTIVVPTRSEASLAVLMSLVGFWVVVIVALQHCQDWLRISAAFRFSHLLSVPAVTASAASGNLGRGTEAQSLTDVEEVADGISGHLLTEAVHLAAAPIFVVMVGMLHWVLAVMAGVMVLNRVVLSWLSHRAVAHGLAAANGSYLRAMGEIGSAANCAEAVEAMGMLPALLRRWSGGMVGGGLTEIMRKLRFYQGLTFFVDQVLGIGPIVVITALHLAGVNMGTGSLGIAALFLMSHIATPFYRMSDKLEETEAAFAAWERLNALAAAERARSQVQTLFVATEGRLVVESLTVQLPRMPQPIIRNLSFRLEPGRVLSLSGPVGCGKSTLLRSIIGIQTPSAGGCYLDGNATHQWDRLDFARHVGYLPQEVGLANGTVADCIARLGPPDLELVLAAARLAGAHNLIVGLPKGYSTRLTEYSLSAGQRQRVALARAIYGRPRLVVLDEPGAWMDEDGLAMLKELIETLKRAGTSVIYSSHEPALLEQADHGILLGPVGTAPRSRNRRQLAAPVAS